MAGNTQFRVSSPAGITGQAQEVDVTWAAGPGLGDTRFIGYINEIHIAWFRAFMRHVVGMERIMNGVDMYPVEDDALLKLLKAIDDFDAATSENIPERWDMLMEQRKKFILTTK